MNTLMNIEYVCGSSPYVSTYICGMKQSAENIVGPFEQHLDNLVTRFTNLSNEVRHSRMGWT